MNVPRTKRRKKVTKSDATRTNVHVQGSRPVHIHTSPATGEQWECNSAYCNEMAVEPPENGGPPIILVGLEPWRGRN